MSGADAGFLKGGGGVQLTSTRKKEGGGVPALGPFLKSLHRGLKGGVHTPAPRDPHLHVWWTLTGLPNTKLSGATPHSVEVYKNKLIKTTHMCARFYIQE